MIETIKTPRFLLIAGIILFGAMMRLVPHWPNFTPIAAMALFGGAYLKKKHLAFIVPFAAMFLSDLILGLHQWMIAVYISFALVVAIGMQLKSRVKVGSVLLATVSASLLFFLITNFAIWYGSPWYTQDFAGLLTCYAAGLPFLNNGIIGDLFFSTIFFGGFYFAQKRFPVFATVELKK
ncbi:MAG: hypothetical protein KDC05_01465 [Bacteroidales bacterium]|nr:hypothetical protein [Bacteroidales bacterium]